MIFIDTLIVTSLSLQCVEISNELGLAMLNGVNYVVIQMAVVSVILD